MTRLFICFIFCTVGWRDFAHVAAVTCSRHLHDIHISRSVSKRGFHRELTTTVEWLGGEDCHAMFVESMPPGMYIAIDQVESQDKYSGTKVRSSVKVNVELPTHKALSHTLWIYTNKLHYESRKSNFHKLSVTLPIHLRYHKPSHGKASQTVTLKQPRLLVKCKKVEENCKGNIVKVPCEENGDKMCEWTDVTEDATLSPKDLSFNVPVGMDYHSTAVTIATSLSAVIGTIWIVSTMVK